MKPGIAVTVAVLCLTSCTASAPQPVPGSLIYGGQPRTKLTKSPIGSTLKHRFVYRTTMAEETYVLQPDRSLKLVRRQILSDYPPR